MKNIVVVGGGAGGLIFANRMAKEFVGKIRTGDLKITVFDGAPYHEFQPGYLGVAFRGKDPERIRKPISNLVLPGVELVPEYCSDIDLDNRFVETQKSGKKYGFDEIVVATGSKPDYSQIPGLSDLNHDFHTSAFSSADLYQRISRIKSGRIVTGIAGLPYKCPPSPNESAFMLDEFFVKNDRRDYVEITFVTPYLRSYSAERINEVIEPIYRERSINVITSFNVEFVDTQKKAIVSMEGESLPFDYLIMVPPHTGVDLLRGKEFADDDGWIFTDKLDMHVKDYDYAFALGDATNIPVSKSGVEAHLEAVVVASNITSELRGLSDRYEFTGRLQCSMETGFRRATFVIGSYDKPVRKIEPSFYNYLQKKLMERIYWSSLMGGYEWLFRRHFGEDYYKKLSGEQPPTTSAKFQGVK